MMLRKLLVCALLVTALSAALPAAAQDGTGTLELYANGGDAMRQGLVSKDGWRITFDSLTVTLADIAAYQTDPPYISDMETDLAVQLIEELADEYVIDLAEGDENATPIYIDEIDNAAAGRYNAVSWSMVNSDDNDGYTMVIIGTAEKNDMVIDFTFNIDTEYAYICGAYVGDETKGFLEPDDSTALELTFHFDRIFGNSDLPLDDAVNTHAPGFDLFARIAEDGVLDATLADLMLRLDPDDYQILVDSLPMLGHVGEGKCYEPTMVIEEDEDEEPAPEGADESETEAVG